ncbi:RICIN domain-containing protein [Nocardia colli]|uniref:RICIN domain-containing protein n=1 Tax=Nocardia colli TaxID=2545717 RepID=UPI0035E04288
MTGVATDMPTAAAEPGSGDVVRLYFDDGIPQVEEGELRCMNLDSDSTVSAPLCQPISSSPRQRWEWRIVAAGVVQLKNVATGLCLDGGGKDSVLYGFSCNADNGNQRFYYNFDAQGTRLISRDSRYACKDTLFGDDKVRVISQNRDCFRSGVWEVEAAK